MKYALAAGLAVMLGLTGVTIGYGQTAIQSTPTRKILAIGTINPGVEPESDSYLRDLGITLIAAVGGAPRGRYRMSVAEPTGTRSENRGGHLNPPFFSLEVVAEGGLARQLATGAKDASFSDSSTLVAGFLRSSLST